jgi:hypothetical protein
MYTQRIFACCLKPIREQKSAEVPFLAYIFPTKQKKYIKNKGRLSSKPRTGCCEKSKDVLVQQVT